MNPDAPGPTIYTVGHSNRSMEELLAVLRAAGIGRLADVRRHPGSRRHPQFGMAPFARALAAAGIEYRHAPELGGHRTEDGPTVHTALAEPALRAYADHMATPGFSAAIDALLAWGRETPLAILCAEADPASCHRRFTADALVHRGAEVVHLLAPGSRREHRPPAFLRWEGSRPVYDGGLLTLDSTLFGEPG